ncbi:exosortase/archaeosortase family protein [bacterium]|nr:exosortase/archaeosortase family protein [bacterium]
MDDPETRNRVILAGVALLFFLYAYVIRHTCLLGTVGSPYTSLMGWLWEAWNRNDSEYAHGMLVPVISAGLAVWKYRKKLGQVPLMIGQAGLGVLLVGVFLYWAGARATDARVLAISMVLVIFGALWYLAGWKWAKELWFPVVFLLFMIPLTFLEERVSFPLRMFVATFSVKLLNVFGMEVLQEGTAIKSITGRFDALDVAAPCSGIRSLTALMALTALYGYIVMDRNWKKWVLFASSIPLAVIGNLARITTLAFVAQGFGSDALEVYHDYSGYVVFGLAILCMLALGSSLNLRFRNLWRYWTQEEVVVVRTPRRATK